MGFQVLFCVSFFARDSRDVRATREEWDKREKRDSRETQDARESGAGRARLVPTIDLSCSQAWAIGVLCYRKEGL